MNKLTAEKCRERIKKFKRLKKQFGIAMETELSLQAFEIALPVLERQEEPEDAEDEFVVMRNPGMAPVIKRPVGEISDYLKQLYQHNPAAVCDVITIKFAGSSGQWVTDGNEMIAMLEEPQPQTDTYRQIENDGWIEWKGGEQPAINQKIEVKRRDGCKHENYPNDFEWDHIGDETDIIAYRVIEQQERERGE